MKGSQSAAAEPAPMRVVTRRCCVCEWRDRAVEADGADPDCPWCHGPTMVEAAAEAVREPEEDRDPPDKNPHAAALGRLGGMKGGPARAAVLTAKRRHEIAVRAARARWRRNRTS